MKLSDLETPALILDRPRLMQNLQRMKDQSVALGVTLRPHLKTTKSLRIADLATGGRSPVTVSTLKEAEYFIAGGYLDITYAVGIAAVKLPHIATLQKQGARLSIVLDSVAMTDEVIAASKRLSSRFHVLVEIDCGAGRGGLSPTDPVIVDIAKLLHQTDTVTFMGVMTHAGHSYNVNELEEIIQIAEDERSAVVTAATAIEAAGIPCPVRSVGSTPTALLAKNLDGVTEMRPGVYMLGDVFQANLKTCRYEDMAVSVLATVINHNSEKNFALIDAGALALSMDTSASNKFSKDIGYGLVYDAYGQNRQVNIVLDCVHQEHGWLRPKEGAFPFANFPIGSKVRIYPNHSCMTAAPYDKYHVVEGGDDVVDVWGKIAGQ